MIHSCICSKCGKWHSHIYPHPKKKLKFVCINCLKKIREGDDGQRKL